MKKTHLYGAVAATMLLAPVTANVLAEENDFLPEATETQEAEGFSDGIVLSPEEGSEAGTTDGDSGNALRTGTGEGESINSLAGSSSGNDEDKVGNLDAGTSKEVKSGETDDTDNTEFRGDETNLPDDFADRTKELKADVSKVTVDDVCDQPVLKAEDFTIPEPVMMDTTVVVLGGSEDMTMNEEFSDPMLLKDYFSKYKTVHVSLWDSDMDTYQSIDVPFEIGNVDLSDLKEIVRQGNNFRGMILYNARSAVDAFNKKYGTNLNQSNAFFLDCVYNQKKKAWQVTDFPGNHTENNQYLGDDTWILHVYKPTSSSSENQNPIYATDEPDPSEFSESKIVEAFLKLKDSVDVVLDNKEKLNIKLTPEMLNVFDYLNTKGRVAVYINIQNLLANTKFSSGNYVSFIQNTIGDSLMDTYNNQIGFGLGYTKKQGWSMLGTNQVFNLVSNTNQNYNKVLDILSTLKVHIKDKDGKFETKEFDFIPETLGVSYKEDYSTSEDPTGWSGTDYHMYYEIYAPKYLQKLEQITGKKYKLADFEGTFHLSESAVTIRDGKWYFQDPYLTDSAFYRTEPLFYVEEVMEAETPIKTEATFKKDNYEIKAESKEDLTGLEVVIDEIEADNNFGLSSNYQTVGYDIHFENEKGEEVGRTGQFTVRIPIPEQFIGKKVRLFHKENADSMATELSFKVIDGKWYEFETTSFSLFVIACDGKDEEPTYPNTPNDPTPSKPSDNTQKPNHSFGTSNNDQMNIQQLKVVTGVSSESAKAAPQSLLIESGETSKSSADTAAFTGMVSTMFGLLTSGFGLSFLLKKRKQS